MIMSSNIIKPFIYNRKCESLILPSTKNKPLLMHLIDYLLNLR